MSLKTAIEALATRIGQEIKAIKTNYIIDSSDLHVDKVNHRIGIGRTDPSHKISIDGGGGESFLVRDNNIVRSSFETYHDLSYYRPILDFKKARLTTSGCLNGDSLGDFIFQGHDGSQFIEAAGFGAIIDTAVSGGIVSAAIYFNTRHTSGGSPTEKMRLSSSGKLGIGITNPTAFVHLPAGTANDNTAPLKFTSGVVLAVPESGVIEFDGTNLYFTPNSTRKTIAFVDTPPPDSSITYNKVADSLKTYVALSSGTNIDLSASVGGKITLSANTAFTFTNFQIGKFYRLIVTANGYTPSFATAARHVIIGDSFGISGTFYVGLECIDATSGSEILLTTIMKVS